LPGRRKGAKKGAKESREGAGKEYGVNREQRREPGRSREGACKGSGSEGAEGRGQKKLTLARTTRMIDHLRSLLSTSPQNQNQCFQKF
jgi:hypothetical protein